MLRGSRLFEVQERLVCLSKVSIREESWPFHFLCCCALPFHQPFFFSPTFQDRILSCPSCSLMVSWFLPSRTFLFFSTSSSIYRDPSPRLPPDVPQFCLANHALNQSSFITPLSPSSVVQSYGRHSAALGSGIALTLNTKSPSLPNLRPQTVASYYTQSSGNTRTTSKLFLSLSFRDPEGALAAVASRFVDCCKGGASLD